MSDVAIRASDVTAAPKDYKVPGAQEILPKSVSANMDGTSAASAWYPCLQLLDPAGNIMFSAIGATQVAAGASADVSWFPGVKDIPPGIWYYVTPVAPATAPALSTPGAAFLNGWQNTQLPDGSYSPLRYRLDPVTQMIRIVGGISGGALGTAAFVLPAQFRPSTDVVMTIASLDGSSALSCSISASSGAVVPLAGAAASTTPSGNAGGDLSGTYPAPTVVAVEETSGPTRLAVAGITDGQFLKRSGSTITSGVPSGTSPLTTKGDLFGHSTVDARIPVGSDTQVLTADSTQTLGVKWAAVPSSGGLVLLFNSTLGGAAASIDTGAGGIAAGHGCLVVIFNGQTSDAASAVNVDIRVNNDAGANYDAQIWYENATTLGNGNAVGTNQWKLLGHGQGGSANYSGSIVLHIPNYDNTTFWKSALAQHMTVDGAANANNFMGHYGCGWRSTAAISRLSIFPDSGLNLVTGSRLTIYGTQ